MNISKVVITGGPGTGKTAIIEELKNQGHYCFDEISREVTIEAQKQGTEQLFLSDPLLFSKKLLRGRIEQFRAASKLNIPQVFFDRGIPDVVAYMDYAQSEYPEEFTQACKNHRYNKVFILAPWQEIFLSDNERYENFEQAKEIHQFLLKTYRKFNYELMDVPFGTVKERTAHILNSLKS